MNFATAKSDESRLFLHLSLAPQPICMGTILDEFDRDREASVFAGSRNGELRRVLNLPRVFSDGD